MELQTREFQVRLDEEERSVSGVAVPFNTPTTIQTRLGTYTETVLPGAVTATDPIVILRNHEGGPIGKVVEHADSKDGWNIRATFLDTQAGNEAYELAKEGIAKSFSIGFLPVEHTEDADGNITRSKIDVREVSLIVYPKSPAYAAAAIKEVRETIIPEGEIMENITKVDLDEVRDSVDELKRSIASFTVVEREPAVDTRSAGEVIKAIAKGDTETIAAYTSLQERAYTGGTTADTIAKDAWVGDLTRIIEEASPLRGVFSTAALPEKGMNIEYAQLKSNTVQVTEQAAEGDDLAFGVVKIETETAPVKTFGGYTTLSFQEIERSNVNILDTSMQALAAQAGKAMNTFFTNDFKAVQAAQLAAGNKVTVSAAKGYAGWLEGVVDAAVKFEDLGMGLDALVVDKATFKTLMALQGEDGRPVMLVTGAGVNNVGSLNVKGLSGDLANVRVVMSGALGATHSAFVNSRAIRLYTSPVVRLQDSNIINLSKNFSVYTLAAVANEIPAAVVAVSQVA